MFGEDVERQFEKLDLNLLKVFEALWLQRNMTRAAETLHITPSAVSHAMRRFRDVLGDSLFVRQNHIMIPTPACERLAPDVLNALGELRNALGHFSSFTPAQSHQHFVIAMQESLEFGILPRLLKLVEAQAPNVEIVSTRLDRDTMATDLANRDLHLVFDVSRPVAPNISHCVLRKDSYSVMRRGAHPVKNTLTPANYLSARHITVSNRAKGASVEEIALQRLGVNRPSIWRCQHYRSAIDVVATTDAMLTLPTSVAQTLSNEKYIVDALPFELPELQTHLYWYQQQENEPGFVWLKSLILSLFINSDVT